MSSPQVGSPGPLPPNAVLVHIGMHKTGTTALQSTLSAMRPDLAAQGVVYAGRNDAHHQPARALLQRSVGWAKQSEAPPSIEVWNRLVTQVRKSPQRVVVSSEYLSGADPDTVRRLVDDLGPERVHVVVGVRSVGPVAVSWWGQDLKQGRTHTLEQWLRKSFCRPESGEPSPYWKRFDPVTVIERWAQVLDPDRFVVVAVDEGNRTVLPETFERLLDLAPGTIVNRPTPMANRGLTAVESELVRRVNLAVRDKITWPEYATLVRYGLIRRLVEIRVPEEGESRTSLPEWVEPEVLREGERIADGIEALNVRVVGDLRALVRPVQRSEGSTPDPLADGVPMGAAVEAALGVVAGSTRGNWSLDKAPAVPRRIDPIAQKSSSELVKILARRGKASVRRRARQPTSWLRSVGRSRTARRG